MLAGREWRQDRDMARDGQVGRRIEPDADDDRFAQRRVRVRVERDELSRGDLWTQLQRDDLMFLVGGGRRKGSQTFTASGSFTVTSGIHYIDYVIVGGGGGSCGGTGGTGYLTCCCGSNKRSVGGSGGTPGGGGGGGENLQDAGRGGLRIIYPGNTRSFPSTCTGNL